jgi:Ca2+:H+ antiporter
MLKNGQKLSYQTVVSSLRSFKRRLYKHLHIYDLAKLNRVRCVRSVDYDYICNKANVQTDKIKRAARRQAWYVEDGGSSFNPFSSVITSKPRKHGILPTQEIGIDLSRRYNSAPNIHLEANEPDATEPPFPRPWSSRSAPELHGIVEADIPAMRATGDDTQYASANLSRQSTTSGSESRKHMKFTTYYRTRVVLFNSWWNCLFPFVPAGFAVRYASQNPALIFGVNFVAVFPLAMLLSFASDDLTLWTGDFLGALINSTFG